MAQDQPAVSSPRSPKRPRASSIASNDANKKPRLSPSPSTALSDDTLRIVTQALRTENRQLLQDREGLVQDKQALDERLTQAQRSLRDLEEDLGRVHRLNQKEMDEQRREFEQKLQDVRTQQDPAGLQESKEINSSVLHSTKEMDRFLQSCELWQKKLTTLSGELEVKVEKVETQELQGVVRDLVTSVEIKTLTDKVQSKQELVQWTIWIQEDSAKCLKEVNRDRQETEIFEAMEKQLVDDRVVELETQLAQKRAVEREKEMELSSLRADQEELMHSSHVVPNEEFEMLVAEKKKMDEEFKQLKKESESVKEENATLKQHNEKLVEETRQLRDKQTQQSMTQDEEIKKLQAQLQVAKTREAKVTEALKSAEKGLEKSKQRKEELKILYAKFSSTMDSVLEKTMRLEELEQELKNAQSNAVDIQTQKEELENQVAQLQQEKSELSAAQLREKDGMSEELTKVQKRYADLSELESRQKEVVSKMQSEIAQLKVHNEALKEQQVKQEHQSVGQPSDEGDKRSVDSDNTLVIQVAEKEALKMFVQRYCAAAEEKCNGLLEKISELESQKISIQEQTKESCSVLHMCTQVDSCDESVRASLLDVMATLEGLS